MIIGKIEITGILFSVFVATILWKIQIVPYRLFTAFTIGLIFYLTYKYLTREKELICKVSSLKSEKSCFLCLVILSVLCILFINPVTEHIELVAWHTISALNLIRLSFSLFLSLFSPGFMIISIFDRNRKFTIIEKVFFSVSTSLLILPFFGCLSFAIGSSISKTGIFFIIFLNLILLIPYVFVERKKSDEKISFDLHEKLILILLLTFVFILFLNKYSLNLTWEFNDIDNYYGYALAFTKDVLPLSPIGPGLNYPFWSSIFFAEFFILSGVPYVNAFQFILVPMAFLPIVSFYIMVSAFFRGSSHKKIPIVATLLGFFGGGLGWIFGIPILASNQNIQNLFSLFIIMARANSGYLVPAIYSTGMQFIFFSYALSSIYTLTWLIYSKRATEIGNVRYVLISFMVALAYLSHIGEIPIFIFIFLTSIMVFKREDVSLYRKYALSIIFGLILVGLADVILNGSYYTQGLTLLSDQAVYPSSCYVLTLYNGSLALAMLAFLLSFIKGHPRVPIVKFKINSSKMRTYKIVFLCVIIYCYGLCLIIWSEVYKTYNSLPTDMHTVPWYGWPNRLGIDGLISLFGLIYLTDTKKNLVHVRDLGFLIFLVPISIIAARAIHIHPLYFEDRITFFIMIPVIMAASYVLLQMVQGLKRRFRNGISSIILGFVLSVILVLGFLPYSLLSIEAMDLGFWSYANRAKLSSSMLDALNFLRLNTPPNGSVLTLSTSSQWYISSYAGLFPVQTFYLFKDPSLILSPLSPETAIYSLAMSQVKYLYLTSADKKELERNSKYSGFVRDYLLKYLPIAFQNEEVTIYEIPDFSIPTSSKTALVISNNSASEFLSLCMVALSQNEYSTVLKNDPTRFNCSTLILTRDLNRWDELENQDFQRYMDWVNHGGRLIVLESFDNWSSLAFANALSIYSENNVEANGIKSQIGNLTFPSTITVPIVHSVDMDVKIVANYTINNESVSPYALTKRVGNGEVTCLVVSPYFSAIETRVHTAGDISRDLFKDLGSLLNVVGLKLDKNIVKRTIYFPQFDYIKEPVNLTGIVSIDTDYVQLPKLNVNRIAIFSNNKSVEITDLNDITIENIEYIYPVKFRINASKISLSGSVLGRYSNVRVIGDFNLTMEISESGAVRMSILNGTALLNETFGESTIQLNIKNNYGTFVLLKNPIITIEGDAFFGSARIYRSQYKMPLWYDDGTKAFEVIGNTTFRIIYADKSINFVDDFAFNGKWLYPSIEQQPSFNEMNIPWFSVLTSPLHVSLVIIIFVVLFYATLRHKNMVIRIRLKS
jgi:hypothetical protein